ncbi:MAG: hypothetical protein U5K71_14985 [Gracilimonas sp.]|nr:hypothetical protein [Gracilimonas sp.]
MKYLFTALLLLSFIGTDLSAQAQQFPEELTLKNIFHEPFIPGTRPSFSHYSPDGKTIYFSWSDSATSDQDLFQVGLSGKNQKEAPEDVVRNYELSPDKKHVLYTKDGDLILANSKFEDQRVIVASKGYDYNPVWNQDGSQFAFVQNGDVWISGVEDAFIKQITAKEEDEPSYSVSGWAGNKLLLSQFDNSDNKEYFFPEYAGQYVETGATRRGIPNRIFSVAPVDSGDVEVVLEHRGYVNADISANGQHFALDIIDAPMKKRQDRSIQYSRSQLQCPFRGFHERLAVRHQHGICPGYGATHVSERTGWVESYLYC